MKSKNYISKFKFSNPVSIAIIILSLALFSSCSEKLSQPPTIKIIVNDDDISAAPTLHVTTGTRIAYRFEIAASAVITDIKTVVFDVSIPTKKISKEVLVGGQTNSTNTDVKGVLFATSDTEILLVVKDVDGNEVAKSFTVIVQ